MLKRFLDFIKDNQLIKDKQKTLLAVSGGPDSVAMVELFSQSGFDFAIAHCNFQLRSDESDEDEQFVVQLSQRYGVPLFLTHFDTKKFAQSKGISIQMAARDLRFEWFKEIKEEHKFDYIATGHHLEDGIETFLINLNRGTGLKGLRGIIPKQGDLIHPLLFCNKGEILNFLKKQGIDYRSDSSNESDKYIRNQLRHHVIPKLQEINSGFNERMSENFERLNNQYLLLEELLQEKIRIITHQKNDQTYVDIASLLDFTMPLELLRVILEPYGFTYSNCKDVIVSLKNGQSGKIFNSCKHQLLRDRTHLIINARPDTPINKEFYRLNRDTFQIEEPFHLEQIVTQNWPDKTILLNPKNASLDAAKLKFPLTIRKWQKGDRFIPFGMKGFKKVSDYLIDNKVSLFDKDNTWVICSGEDIVWLVGHRVDNRYKIDKNTDEIMVLKLK